MSDVAQIVERVRCGISGHMWWLGSMREDVRALLDEVKRLQDAALPARINDQIHAQLEAAEAELARLRSPAGAVGEVVQSLDEALAEGAGQLAIDCRDILTRQAAEIEEAKRVDALNIETIMKMNREIIAAETRLREAVEVMREADQHLYEVNMSNYDHDEVTRLNDGSVNATIAIRHFLAKLEPTMTVIDEIAAERRRQIEVEGWTPEHDDKHSAGQMADAAAVYAMTPIHRNLKMDHYTLDTVAKRLWPWAATWWKPTTRRRDLIKAAALIVAEIERLDRLETNHE